MRKCFLSALLLLLASAFSQAQFLGYVGLQTTQQTLASSLNCTGSAQIFPINNLGQTQHYLSVSGASGAVTLTAEIDGIDRSGVIYRISDVLENAGFVAGGGQGALYGSGYYPSYQAKITCSPNGALFSASYSGGAVPNYGNAGTYLTAQIDKTNFSGASATVTVTDSNEQTPFGSSAGTLIFRYSSVPTTAGTLAVMCATIESVASPITVQTVSLAPVTSLQFFPVPDSACPFSTVTYTPGTGGTVVSAEYIFAVPGLSNHASADPCQSGSAIKTATAVTAGAAASTQILPANSSLGYYVCGYQISQAVLAGTVQWEYGSGTNCGTGTVVLTGAMQTIVGQPFTYSGPGSVMKVPFSNALCVVTTGAGATVAGIVTSVLAP
jgi:hypothetical protein